MKIEIKIDKLITKPININKLLLKKSKKELIDNINTKFTEIIMATK